MIDLRHPETIRVISESPNGTVVSDDLTKSQPEAKFVLQAALGMSGSTSYLLADKNLVVEGVDDYWLLTELSRLLKQSSDPHLSDEVFITPAGGASEAGYIATIMIGQDLDVVVLLDSDTEFSLAPVSQSEAPERFWAASLPTEREHISSQWADGLLDRPTYVLRRGLSPLAAAEALDDLAASLR
jgi:hypothetical protein